MLKMLGVVAAMMSSAAAGGASDAPIYLVAEAVGEEAVRFQVIGASNRRIDAAFTLEVKGSGNQSVHRGSASLTGGGQVTLSTVTLGNAGKGEWRALLRVEPQGGQPYEQVRTSF